ncbi:MAG: hypothetical protein Q9169_002144 [Polycauliona sp. 2 TL-2023]
MHGSATDASKCQSHRKKTVSPFHGLKFTPYKIPYETPSLFQTPTSSDANRSLHKNEDLSITRHIKFDFTLFEDAREYSGNSAECRVIMDLFPTCHTATFQPPFLTIVCSTLPTKPWPATVAGLPLFLTDDPEEEPMDYGIMCSGPKITIDASIERWQTPTTTVFQMVFEALGPYDVSISQIQWIGWSFLALVPTTPAGDWRRTLPWMINGICIGYVFGDEVPQEKSLRTPTTTATRYQSACDDLRPSVTVAGRFLTTPKATIGEPIWLDTPSHGMWEGMLIGVVVQQKRSDEPLKDTQYISGSLVYFGDGADIMFDGHFGDVIWHEDSDEFGESAITTRQAIFDDTARASKL